MSLGQQQTIGQTQSQRLTQQQLQLIKMLEIPALEMEARVLQEIDDNPALEFGEDPDEARRKREEDEAGNENEENEDDEPADDSPSDTRDADSEDDRREMEEYIADYDDKAADFGRTQNDEDNRREPFMGIQTDSLQEYLLRQLADLDTTPLQQTVGEYIIGNIDSDGYLRADARTIADQISFQTSREVELYQVEQMLEQIQEFEPAGVAAKDLQECLLLQLERKDQTEVVEQAHDILEHCFEEFSDRDYDYIRERLSLTAEALQAAVREITRLTPKPGNAWETSQLTETGRQITADFLVDNHDGKLEVTLNDTSIPDLHVSRSYLKMWEDYQAAKSRGETKGSLFNSRKEGAMYAKKKIDAANWFIDAIRQRQNTLTLTMQAIVDHQKAFFLSGDEKKLRPMKLKDIAAVTGLDMSTVSRVSNCKFVETEIGTFPLKYFFSEGIQNENGEEISVREIQSTLRDLVAKEDPKAPYTDDALTDLLKKKGYAMARRTVAKYREVLGIASSKERKRLS